MALAVFAGVSLALWVIRKTVVSRLKRLASRTETSLDDFLIGTMERSLFPLLYYGAFYLSIRGLTPNAAKRLFRLRARFC